MPERRTPGGASSTRPARPAASLRRLRRRLILWTLPLVLVALVFAGKLFSMPVIAQGGIDDYEASEFEQAASGFDRLGFWNAFESWIVYFDRGTTYAAGGAYGEATDDLSLALAKAPEDMRCTVRVNLALAWEQQGDVYAEQGYGDRARELWETSLEVIEDGKDEGCFDDEDDESTPPPSDDPTSSPSEDPTSTPTDDPSDEPTDEPSSDPTAPATPSAPATPGDGSGDDSGESGDDATGTPGENLREAEIRVKDKLDQDSGGGSDGSDDGSGSDDSDDESSGQDDDLEQKQKDAERQKRDQDAENRGSTGDDGTDKPW